MLTQTRINCSHCDHLTITSLFGQPTLIISHAARHLHHLVNTASTLCVIIVYARPSLQHASLLHHLANTDCMLCIVKLFSQPSLHDAHELHHLANADNMLCVIIVSARPSV